MSEKSCLDKFNETTTISLGHICISKIQQLIIARKEKTR